MFGRLGSERASGNTPFVHVTLESRFFLSAILYRTTGCGSQALFLGGFRELLALMALGVVRCVAAATALFSATQRFIGGKYPYSLLALQEKLASRQ